MRSLLGRVILVVVFSFHHFKYVLPLPSGLQSFCWKKAVYLMGIPLYVICCFSLAAFNIFSLYSILIVWLICVLACFPLDLSCMGLQEWVWYNWFEVQAGLQRNTLFLLHLLALHLLLFPVKSVPICIWGLTPSFLLSQVVPANTDLANQDLIFFCHR